MQTNDSQQNHGKLILVTGATGAQGGSVTRALLAHGFSVRALTRNPDSAAAAALRDAGAEVVRGDLGDTEALKAAMEGCYGVFGLTNFWEHFHQEAEHGNNLIDAVAASPQVQHFVFSTLPSYIRLSGGELAVPHCDIKAELEDRTRAMGLPATFVHVAYYYENFESWFAPRAQADGTLGFGFPQGDTPLAAVAVEDTGGVVAAIFEQRDRFLGKRVGIVGDDLPPAAYAEAMSRATGRHIGYQHIPREVFASFGFPGAEELANMFDVQRHFIPQRAADVALSRELFPEIRTFEQWVASHAAAVLSAA
jgi:uncharacterized protein YbjT (DUF2867 family)